MNRILTELPATIGVLLVGMMLGAWLAGSTALWWVVVALAVVAIAVQLVLVVRRSRKAQSAA